MDNQISEKENNFLKKFDEILDQYYLVPFQKVMTVQFLKNQIGDKENKKVERIREWILLQINKKKYEKIPEMQLGCPEIIPKLTASPFWENSNFSWIQKFEENFDLIKEELINLRNQKGFQPYRGPTWTSKIKAEDGVGSLSHDSGEWNVFYLFLHEMKFTENCNKAPLTVELIEKYIPRHYCHAFFSAMSPGTHIMKHHGPTNKKLRFHLPLIGVKGSKLRAGNEIMNLEEKKGYVFDDSFEHEAWHDGENTRLILIVDFWHPDLSNEEVKFLTLLRNSKLRFEKAISDEHPDKDNFYSIIESSRDLLSSNNWWK